MRLLILLLLLALPARAEITDCTDPAWRNLFPETREIGFARCIELFSITFAAPNGSVTLRAVTEADTTSLSAPAEHPWDIGPRGGLGAHFGPSFLDGIEPAVRQTLRTLPQLGDYQMSNVTILLTPLGTAPASVIGSTRTIDTPFGRECLISAFTFSPGATSQGALSLVAHEMFHCVQQASLSPEQAGNANMGNDDWWFEGSAEAFADLVSHNTVRSHAYGLEFDESVASNRPLYRMSYQASVFFRWLMQTAGTEALLPFLHQMAGGAGQQAQINAMQAALPQTDWLHFATDYASTTLTDFAGRPVGGDVPTGLTVTVNAEGDYPQPLTPFTFALADIEFGCGIWDLTLDPTEVSLAEPFDAENAWAPLPAQIDTKSDTAQNLYRFVAFPAITAPTTLTLNAHLVEGCEPCGPVAAQDACMIGTWKLTSGGIAAVFQARHLPIRNLATGPFVFQMQRGGRLAVGPGSASGEADIPDPEIAGQASVLPVAGRWSTADGQLYICLNHRTATGKLTMQVAGHSQTVMLGPKDAQNIQMDYTCHGRAMTTLLTIPRLGPVPSGYTRLAR